MQIEKLCSSSALLQTSFHSTTIFLLILSIQDSDLQYSNKNQSSIFGVCLSCCDSVPSISIVTRQNLGVLAPDFSILGFPPSSSIRIVSRFYFSGSSARTILWFPMCIPCYYCLPKGLNLAPQRWELFVQLYHLPPRKHGFFAIMYMLLFTT